MLAVLETAMPVALLPVATALYRATAAVFPGAVFMAAAGASGLCAGTMLALALLRSPADLTYSVLEGEEPTLPSSPECAPHSEQ